MSHIQQFIIGIGKATLHQACKTFTSSRVSQPYQHAEADAIHLVVQKLAQDLKNLVWYLSNSSR